MVLYQRDEACRVLPPGERASPLRLFSRLLRVCKKLIVEAYQSGRHQVVGSRMQTVFDFLGLYLHPDKCDFSGSRRLKILVILEDTEEALSFLISAKLAKIELHVRRLLWYASHHRLHVPGIDIRRFAELGNLVTQAVVDSRLPLRELFIRVKACHVFHSDTNPGAPYIIDRTTQGMISVMSRVTCHVCHGSAPVRVRQVE